MRPVLLAALAALTLTTCSGSGGGATGTATPTATAPPTASPAAGAADELATRAAAGLAATYTATYRLAAPGKPVVDVRIYRDPARYRVDLVTGPSTAILIGTDTASYSCQVAGAKRTCFQVATGGQPLPTLFDPGVQHLVTDYLAALSRDRGGYQVARAGTTAAGAAGVPAGQCFTVAPLAAAQPPVVPAGRYCLSENGVPTQAGFPSGALTLQAVAGPPAATLFAPPASPTPLPSP